MAILFHTLILSSISLCFVLYCLCFRMYSEASSTGTKSIARIAIAIRAYITLCIIVCILCPLRSTFLHHLVYKALEVPALSVRKYLLTDVPFVFVVHRLYLRVIDVDMVAVLILRRIYGLNLFQRRTAESFIVVDTLSHISHALRTDRNPSL